MDASQARSRSFLRRMTVFTVMSLAILSLTCSLENSVVEAVPIPLVSLIPSYSSSPSDMSTSYPPLLKRSGTSPATDRMSAPNYCNPDSYVMAYCKQGNSSPPPQSYSDSGSSSSSSGYNRENVPSPSYSGGNNGSNRPAQDNSRRD